MPGTGWPYTPTRSSRSQSTNPGRSTSCGASRNVTCAIAGASGSSMPTIRRSSPDHGPPAITTRLGAQRSPVGGHRRLVLADLYRGAPLGHRELGARSGRVGRQRPHRGFGEHRARVGVEQPALIGLDSELREATPNVGRIEFVERSVACAHRGRQRLELRVRSKIDLSGLEQERDVLRRLQPMPSLERRPGETHVALVVVGEPDRTATRPSTTSPGGRFPSGRCRRHGSHDEPAPRPWRVP